MARGKRHTEAEDYLIAKACAWATNDEIKGCEQKKGSFNERVLHYLKRHGPKEKAMAGTHHDRDVAGSQRHIGKMKQDVAKFMATLRSVLLVEWSGLSFEQKVNIAVAVCLGKAKKPSHDWKDFEATAWPNYCPYQVLSTLPQFSIPVMPRTNSVAGASNQASVDDSSSLGLKQDGESNPDDSSPSDEGGMKRQASCGGSGVKRAKLELLEKKKEESCSKEISTLNASIKQLVDETRKTREDQEKDREMAELVTVLDHSKNSNDLVNFLENKVCSCLGVPKPVPNTVGVAHADDDQSGIGY